MMIIIYDCHIFIVQATDALNFWDSKSGAVNPLILHAK